MSHQTQSNCSMYIVQTEEVSNIVPCVSYFETFLYESVFCLQGLCDCTGCLCDYGLAA